MAYYFDEQLGRVVSDEEKEEEQSVATPSGVELLQMPIAERAAFRRQQQQPEQEDPFAPEDPKPFIAQGPGQALGEVFKQTANAGAALVTDYGDLASYLGDTLVQTGNVVQGKRFETENFMNDSDNPWTQWRLNSFEPETQLGMKARPFIRGAVALLTLPKVALKGALLPLKALGKAPVIGGVAQKGVKGLTAADKAIKGIGASDDVARVTKSLEALKAPASARLIGGAAKTPWLYSTYDDVGRAIAAGEPLTGVKAMMDNTRQSVKALTNLNKLSGKQKIKTIGEALAWDAFVAFNMGGEGDLSYDEGLSNWLVDSGMPWATAIGSPLSTSADDAAIARKFKMTAEGTMFGGLLNGVFDMWRVSRFAAKFRAADVETKAAILNRFNGQAQDIGSGIGGLELGAGGGQGIRLGLTDLKQAEEAAEAFAKQQRVRANNQAADFREAQKGGSLATTNRGVDGGLLDENGLPLSQGPGELVEPGQTAGELATTNPGRNLDALPPGALPGEPGNPRVGQPAPERPSLPGGEELVEPVNVTVPPMVEPVITPQTIRSGFSESLIQKFRNQPIDLIENTNGEFVQLKDLTKSLMPTTRTGMLQYMLDNPPQINALGLEDGVDALWRNFLTDRGLQEGWATIDPDTMQVKWNRSVARDLDTTDLDLKQAETVDDAVAYEQWQSSRGRTSNNPPNDAVQQRLGEMDNPTPPPVQGPDPLQGPARPDESARLQETLRRTDSPNPPNDEVQARLREMDLAEGKIADEVVDAAADTAAYNASELRRIEEAASSPVTDPDYQLVNEMLGQNLDDIGEPEIIKATTGRGWEVYGADGELLGRTQTKRAANKLAEKQKRIDREAVVAKARQLSEDGGDQVINSTALDDGATDTVSGKIKLTDRQIDYLRIMGVQGLESGKKTFSMTSKQMTDIRNALEVIASDPGTTSRVYRNMLDKFDTALKLMGPEVRANRTATRLLEDTESLVTKGEVCNFLEL